MTALHRFDLSEEEFQIFKELLPPERPRQAGRPWVSHRQVLNGIFYMLRTGAPWRDLPESFGFWSTVYGRFRRWRKEGVWQKILDTLLGRSRRLGAIDFSFSAFDGSVVRAHKAAAGARKTVDGKTLSPEESQQKQALGISRGGLSTKIHILCEGQGGPIAVVVTPGQRHESMVVEELLDQRPIGGKPGRPRLRFTVNAGDKGYDFPKTRQQVRQRGGRPLIPHRKRPDGSYPPQAAGFDKEQYRQRNVVERLIGHLKEYHRIAMRVEKLAESFVAVLLLGFIRIWLRDLL